MRTWNQALGALLMATMLLVTACGLSTAPAAAPGGADGGGAAAGGGTTSAGAGGSTASTGAGESTTGAPEKSKVILAVGGASCLCYLPATLAYHMGYFKDEGLEVELQDFKGGSKALEALIGGSADVVSGYYEHTIRMQTKNKAIQTFVNFNRYPGLVLAVAKNAEGKIQSVKDLKGATIGVTAPGSATHAFVNYLLSREGLKPEDVSIVGIGLGATSVAAMEQGTVGAAALLDPAVTQLEQRGSLGRILVDTRTEADTRQVFGGGYAAGGLYTTVQFIKENPNTVQRLTNAIVRTLQYVAGHSAEEIAAQLPQEYYAGDKELYVAALKAQLDGYSRDGLMPPDAPKSTLEALALADEGVAAARDQIRLDETYTNQFAQKAAGSQ